MIKEAIGKIIKDILFNDGYIIFVFEDNSKLEITEEYHNVCIEYPSSINLNEYKFYSYKETSY